MFIGVSLLGQIISIGVRVSNLDLADSLLCSLGLGLGLVHLALQMHNLCIRVRVSFLDNRFRWELRLACLALQTHYCMHLGLGSGMIDLGLGLRLNGVQIELNRLDCTDTRVCYD